MLPPRVVAAWGLALPPALSLSRRQLSQGDPGAVAPSGQSLGVNGLRCDPVMSGRNRQVGWWQGVVAVWSTVSGQVKR